MLDYVRNQELDCYSERCLWFSAKRAVMVTGEAGSGKSALLANWLNLTKERQNQLSLYHFIGCAEGTTSMYKSFSVQMLFRG